MWGMVCGRKRPLGKEKSDDHGRQIHRPPLGNTKLSIWCVCECCTHIADAGGSNECLHVLYYTLYAVYVCLYSIYLTVRLGVAYCPAHLPLCSVSAQWQMTAMHWCEQAAQNAQLKKSRKSFPEWQARMKKKFILNLHFTVLALL